MAKTYEPGEVSQRAGKTMLLMGFLLMLAFKGMPQEQFHGTMYLLLVVPKILIGLGAALYLRGRQHASKASAAAIIADDHPGVLYLRAFATDGTASPSDAGLAMLSPAIVGGLLTAEEQLREVMEPFGEMVAVGKPDESLPTPGAARLYVPDTEWKDVVARRMSAARIVVIRADRSAGVLWELERATQLLEPRRLLILFLNMYPREYDAFRRETASLFKGDFPPYKEIKHHWTVSGFLSFGPDWQSTFLPLRAPWYRCSPYKSHTRLFKAALKPVFAEFGLSWEAPSISALTVSISVMAAASFLLVAVIAATNP
jgi:hypothetical protein